ncbi:hypothetical protein B0H67DRAFT_252773 [Lasiosphaeris hirsuta]|uniref:F-box domain-containing protein n=1 Tax=Lasiosphaeris hirsuta TaxID=260670 RepID=A0AA40AHE7_9PEZI|nr:hypothetical protein B0H67DRAFT_252773 [Lasiosphaeris hirsuta]
MMARPSRLCALPEELLMMIIELLDPTSIQCLRRASRIFLRLFSSPCFSHQHNKELSGCPELSWLPYTPWPRPGRIYEAQAHARRFIEYLERDTRRSLCAGCRETANGLDGMYQARNLVKKSAYCVGCDEKHPLAYFSAAQRYQKDEMARVCIGHEGYVRLCEHKVIEWKTVANAMRQLTSRPITDEIVSVLLEECNSAIHIPTNHEITSQRLTKVSVYPTLELTYRRDCGFYLVLSWLGHLPLPEPLSSGRRYSVGDITDRLILLRQQGAAEYIAPQSRPGYLPEMRLFDPNRCHGFLDYAGTPAGAGGLGAWSLASPSDHLYQACRTNLGSECLLRHPNPIGTATEDQDGLPFGSHYVQTFSGAGTGTLGGRPPYGLTLRAKACASSGSCIEVNYVNHILVADTVDVRCKKVTHSWCEALSPESYNLVQDGENYGTLWCWNGSCANYYRYVERPVVLKCRSNAGVTLDWFESFRDWRPTTTTEATRAWDNRVGDLAHGSEPSESSTTSNMTEATRGPKKGDNDLLQDMGDFLNQAATQSDEKVLQLFLQFLQRNPPAHDRDTLMRFLEHEADPARESVTSILPLDKINERPGVDCVSSTSDSLQPKLRERHGKRIGKFLSKCWELVRSRG